MNVAILRDIRWGSHLVQMVDLKSDPPSQCQMDKKMEILRYLHWYIRYLVHKK